MNKTATSLTEDLIYIMEMNALAPGWAEANSRVHRALRDRDSDKAEIERLTERRDYDAKVIKALVEAAKGAMSYRTDGGSGMCGGSQMQKMWTSLEEAIVLAQEVGK